ncbi:MULTISPECIES: HD family hydrolase [unclassified Archaeoglobus]|jgi:putative hydrolase of HD superfamily|uniref:HD family hydrolase n=1 Tax=unclassified Archaeoglobus TaxID=2643606 RepID=UPI0025BED701|nr:MULTISPECIES: HD family hydrolase [unclassified Archaeoglobus]
MEDIVRFIHEAGSLKLVPRSGWLKLGIKLPESVAEHSFRTALIAFILALKNGEGLEVACKAATAALFHDLHESRTMDLHKIAQRYVIANEKKAKEDQLSWMEFEPDFSEVEDYVDDADKLELAFQAVEYADQATYALKLAEKVELKTEIAKEIYQALMVRKNPVWWR